MQLKRLGVVFTLVNGGQLAISQLLTPVSLNSQVVMYVGLLILYILDLIISHRVYSSASEDISTVENITEGYIATLYLTTSLGNFCFALWGFFPVDPDGRILELWANDLSETVHQPKNTQRHASVTTTPVQPKF